MRITAIRRALLVATTCTLVACNGTGLLGVSGTTITDAADARALWEARGPREYSFELEIGCFCVDQRAVIVYVQDRVVRAVRYADDRTLVGPQSSMAFPTLEGLFELIEQARANGAFFVRAEFDARYGYPRALTIDRWEGVADDEVHYGVSRVTRR